MRCPKWRRFGPSLDSAANFLSRAAEFRDEFSFAKADQDAEAS